MEDIRQQFPLLERKVYGHNLVYLDNAATSQKPKSVLELQGKLLTQSNANIHRAVHKLSAEMTQAYEEGREAARAFINAPSREEVIFTSGTTGALNLVASCFTQRYMQRGDKVLVSEAEHHSNIVPWQLACERTGATVESIPIDDSGAIDLNRLESRLDERVKIISVAHASNVLGIVNPIRELAQIAHSRGIVLAVDGAQGIVHTKVDVQALGCDFYAFSGHKIYAPTGIGVLYGKRGFLEQMPPYMGGGDMIDTVTFEKTTYAPLPMKFEAGTQNFIAAACLKPALETAAKIRADIQLQQQERKKLRFLMEELPRVEGCRIYGTPLESDRKVPLFSFTVDGVHASDLALILDKMGIAVRSGHMCAEPLMNRLGITNLLRVSLAPYNTFEECVYFIESLQKAVEMLKK